MGKPRSAPGGVPRKELLMGRQHSVDAGLKTVPPRDKRATPVNTGEKLSLLCCSLAVISDVQGFGTVLHREFTVLRQLIVIR